VTPALLAAAILLFAHESTSSAVGPQVVLAAGDIADCSSQGDEETAALLDSNGGTILTLGDNAYYNGTAQEFADCYQPTWGGHKARTRPAPGNHDYNTPGAIGYFDYFGEAAGPAGKGYYSFDLGRWHIVSLNSESDTAANGAQARWLEADLQATTADCVLAYWHKPRWTNGNYSDLFDTAAFWNLLYDAGADVVLAGHDHNYQRYPKLGKTGLRDPDGIRSFVVGTGGRHLYALAPDPRREAGTDAVWGVLKLTLRETGFDWEFLSSGGTYTDSGSADCSIESGPSPPPVPPPPGSPPPPPGPPPPPATPRTPPSPAVPPSPGPQPPTTPATPQPMPGPPPQSVPGRPQRSPLTIGRGPVRVSASGSGRIWLACARDGPDCRGRITALKQGLVVGFGKFALSAASARPVDLRLSPRAVRRLASRRIKHVDLVAAPADGRLHTARTVRLELRPRR
jgi:calcineurin-like phosphoesterase family protein